MLEDSGAFSLSLGGDLADFPLPDVLTFLNMGLKTGALEAVSSGGAVNRLYLLEGEVVHATSRVARFQLPSFLAARGLLTEGEAQALARRAQREHRAFRDLVLESAVVGSEEMADFEKLLYSEIAFEAMRWREGNFTFAAGRRPDDGATLLRISVQNLIMEGARRLDEASRFEQEARIDRSLVVTLVCATGRLESDIVLTPLEWGVISLINGKRTLEEIFALSPAGSEADTWAVVQNLQAARLIQVHVRGDMDDEVTESVLLEDKTTAELPSLAGLPAAGAPEPSDEMTAAVDQADLRLISGTHVTSSAGMFGRRLPARLVEVSDPSLAFELARPVLTVGRSVSNDIVLPHPSVSKQHAELLQDGEGWRILDLKSTNGTLVNNLRVTERRLEAGDTIDIGGFTFRFDAVPR